MRNIFLGGHKVSRKSRGNKSPTAGMAIDAAARATNSRPPTILGRYENRGLDKRRPPCGEPCIVCGKPCCGPADHKPAEGHFCCEHLRNHDKKGRENP